ncbi:MAG: hypothetical protein ABR600_05955 [Actinomycetota bacterium]
MRRTLVSAVAMAVLWGSAAAAALPGPQVSASGISVAELSRSLTQAAMPETPDACSVEITLPQQDPRELGCEPQASVATPDAGDPTVSLTTRDSVETTRWYPALAPLGGAADGEYVRVHGYGNVAAMRPDGTMVWNRPATSFFHDWGLKRWIVPFVLLGVSPIDPSVEASEHPYAVGDLSGDGVDDVAVAHFIRQKDVDSDGNTHLWSTSAVTLLDGLDGHTLWWRFYPGYVTQVLAVGDTLVVGDETGDVRGFEKQGADGTSSSLIGVRFARQGDGVDGSTAWTYATGDQWARLFSAEAAGPGRVAFSWSPVPLNATGHVAMVTAATGALVWRAEIGGYPRALRYDPSIDEVVVATEADPYNPDRHLSFSLLGLDGRDGTVLQTFTRPNSLMLSLAVGDPGGTGAAQWIVGYLSQFQQTPNGQLATTYVESHVEGIDPATGGATSYSSYQAATRAAQGQGQSVTVPLTYSILVAPGRVVLGQIDNGTNQINVRNVPSPGGWSAFIGAPYPLFLALDPMAGGTSVLGPTSNQIIKGYALQDGANTLTTPLLGDMYAVAAADVNGDGTKDLIAGGENATVFALDGAHLGANPRILWQRAVAGPVHEIQVADLDAGEPKAVPGPEIVVAASKGLSVLHSTGSEAWSVSMPTVFVWTFTLGDVDGDGGEDVILPTRGVSAMDGATGADLWDFGGTVSLETMYFSNAVLTPDHKVVAQFLVYPPALLASRSHEFVVALDAATGDVAWLHPTASKFAMVDLWRSVAVDPSVSGTQGSAVAATWEESPDATAGWYPHTDVYDSANGNAVFSFGPDRGGVVHMGTDYVPGQGLVEFNWQTVTQVRQQAGHEVRFEATADVAQADFGPQGAAFLRSWIGVDVYPTDVTDGAGGDSDPEASSRWDDLEAGQILVQDLDGDGSDEVITLPFDWSAYAQVAAFSGSGVSSASLLPHGIAVLEASR